MPNRNIRDGLLDSELVDQLSPEGERLLVRMMLAGDDAGRITGRLDVLRSRCFPLKPGLPLADLQAWLTECEAAGAVLRYQFEGKAFIQIAKTQRYGKTMYSKSPWSDGSFQIQYVSRETRDGNKEFVSTSLFLVGRLPVSPAVTGDGMSTPSAPHSDGVGMGSDPMRVEKTITSTNTRTNTRTDSPPSAQEVSEEKGASSENAVREPNVFDRGIALLERAGEKRASARTFIAGLCKQFGDPGVMHAIDTAEAKDPPPVDPKAWLRKVASEPPQAFNGKRKSTAIIGDQPYDAGWGAAA